MTETVLDSKYRNRFESKAFMYRDFACYGLIFTNHTTLTNMKLAIQILA